MQELFDLPNQYDQMLNKGIGVTGNDKYFFIAGRLKLLTNNNPENFRPTRILDFGCGTGATANCLSSIFPEAQIIGTDISLPTVLFATKHFSKSNLRFVEFNDLSLLEPFDLVYINCVLHHVKPLEREKMMTLIYKVCKPDAIIWIFENNPANPGTQLAMYTNPFDKGVVKVWPSELKAMLKTSGFQYFESYFIFYFPQWLSLFRPIEKYLLKFPLGGQYGIMAIKP